jgi:hypothetical protein
MNTTPLRQFGVSITCAIMLIASAADLRADAAIKTARVPDGGLQPQVCVDDRGALYLIYLKGEASASDIFYVRSSDAGKTWSTPIRVNSESGAAIATGTVRGAHLAIGRDARPHVAWMGSQKSTPRGPGNATPMLYARLADDGKSFEPQRNVLTERVGLDGGGSIAIDAKGHVFVGWHAPPTKGAGEGARAVWVARSDDGGRTFAKETLFSPGETGACACCGMRLFADGDKLLALYRAASEKIHRDMYLVSQRENAKAAAQKIAAIDNPLCLMSTVSLTRGKAGVLAAWETDKQIEWGTVSAETGQIDRAAVHAIAGTGQGGRKHPSIAANDRGQVLVAWAEGTGWQRGGSAGWQLFDAEGKPVANGAGRAEKLPVWSFAAPAALKDGTFLVLY